ncbi:hypothetical protein DFH06DRAFT_1302463 [Mycena polygramma]|nr:hypothetical protein DFH06DRAFT_1302463 [Mycena polygramma]
MLLEVDDVDAKALLTAIPGLLQAQGNPDLARLLLRLQQQLNPPSLGPPLELAPPNRLRNIENTPRDTENLVNKENLSRTPPHVSAFPRQHLYSPYGTTLLTTPPRGASRSTPPNSEDSPMPMADEESSAPALLPRASVLLPEFMLRALCAASASPPPSRPITPPLCPATPMHPTTPVNRPTVLPSTSILSPLRFSGDDDDDELLSPSSTLVNLSPTKSACGDQTQVSSDSSAASLLGKCTAAEAGLEDGPRRSRHLASSVTECEADGTGNTNGGTHHANSKPPCPRKGDKARVSSKTRRGRAAGNVQAMQATLTKELSNAPSGKSGRKKKKTAGGRYVMGAPPPPATRDSGLRIVGLGLVPLSVELQQNLLALLRELQPPPPPSEGVSQEDGPAALTGESSSPLAMLANPPPPPPSAQVSSFAQAMLRCSRLEKKGILNNFELMGTFHLKSFEIIADGLLSRQNVPAGEKRPSFPELALEVADPSVNSTKIQYWYTAGTRLSYLAACSSMYILPIIAACGLRHKICKEDFFDTIEEIGYLLCAPHTPDEEHVLSRDCGNIVRQYICPQMVWIKQMMTNLGEKMVVNFPSHSNVPAESIPFSSILRMDAKLRTFNFEYWALPPHDPCWRALENPLLAPVLPLLVDDLDLTEDCVTEEVTIPYTLSRTPPGDGGKAWSEAEQLKGAAAKVVGSIGELESELSGLLRAPAQTAGPRPRPLGAEPRARRGGPLHGADARREADCVVPEKNRRSRNRTLDLGKTLDFWNFYDEDGERRSDTYLCVPTEIMDGKVLTIRDRDDEVVSLVITNIAERYLISRTAVPPSYRLSWRGRYTPSTPPRGVGAPEGIHPNLLHREDTEKMNYRQRAPYTTRETRDNPEEAELLEELIKLITIVIEVHLRKLVPDEHCRCEAGVGAMPCTPPHGPSKRS